MKQAWSCFAPIGLNRLRPRSPRPSYRLASTSLYAANVRICSDARCKQPSATASSPAFNIRPREPRNQKRRLYERSKAFLEIYRWRAGIEATMSHLKHQMKMASLRIRGMSSMRYVVNLRALGLNIRRCAAFGS